MLDSTTADAAIAALAMHQHGAFTWRQARRSGVSSDAARTRIEQGRWLCLTREVFAIAGSPATEARELMALVLATGGVASHLSAGHRHRLHHLPDVRRPEVTVGMGRSPRSPLGHVHRSRDLHLCTLVAIDSIPTTDVARTLLDIAGMTGPVRFPRILDDALDRRLVTIAMLDACLTRHRRRGRPGVSRLSDALHARGDGAFATESVLERRFLALCDRFGIPLPRTQVRLEARGRVFARCDCVWEDAKLIVELDGRRGHTQLVNRELDAARDQEAIALGWRVMRVTWQQVTGEPRSTADRIQRALRTARVERP